MEMMTLDFEAVADPVIAATTRHVVGNRTVVLSSGYQRVLAERSTPMFVAYVRTKNMKRTPIPDSNITRLTVETTFSYTLPLLDSLTETLELAEICAFIYVQNGCMSDGVEGINYTEEERTRAIAWYRAAEQAETAERTQYGNESANR